MLHSIMHDVERHIKTIMPKWYVCCPNDSSNMFIVRCSEFRISDVAVYVNDMNVQFYINDNITTYSNQSTLPNLVYTAIASIEQTNSTQNPNVLALAVMEYLKEEHSNWLVHTYTYDMNLLTLSLRGVSHLSIDTQNMKIYHATFMHVGISTSNAVTFTEYNIFSEINKCLKRIESLAYKCNTSKGASERRESVV